MLRPVASKPDEPSELDSPWPWPPPGQSAAPDVQLLTPPVAVLIDDEHACSVAVAYNERAVLVLDSGGEQRTRWVPSALVARLAP